MLAQYFKIKEKNKDNILFFRLGDFYEMFGEDAIKASRILDITLTARHKGTENEIPMCGIPYHAGSQYIAKLTKVGCNVAICEQTSDSTLPGIVKREVVQVITPGTTLDFSLLDKSENNFLVSVVDSCSSHTAEQDEKSKFGVAFVDLTTGEFKVCEISGKDNLLGELKRINPAEVLVDAGVGNATRGLTPSITGIKMGDRNEWYWIFKNVNKFISTIYFEPEKILCEQFKTQGLEGFGIQDLKIGIKAAANLVMYLRETQKTQLTHLNRISLYNPSDFMVLDEATIRNLDLVYNYQQRSKEGSLLNVLDKTATGMGARMLRQWILHPLLDIAKINERIEKVSYFFHRDELRNNIREQLKEIRDIERLIAKIGCRRANGRDLIGLKESLKIILKIEEILGNEYADIPVIPSVAEGSLHCDRDDNHPSGAVEIQNVIEIIEKMIIDDPPILIIEGGIIKEGNDQELDDLRKISLGGKEWIVELQAKERARTGINSLKVKFNRVFGYYIEISNANLDVVPEDYTRKQTLVNGERFITPELKAYEEKVLTAEEKIRDIEYRIFNEIISKLEPYLKIIQNKASEIAMLDVYLNFSQISREYNYIKPNLFQERIIDIKEGRHPVIERIIEKDFIPNDLFFNDNQQNLIILTGPNMAGKSVYLRQNGLIVLMAQIGCFAPAREANLSVVDRIFTRVGASDNIAYGQSTFMVEMQEAANILNNATDKSLIIFDELGRGTSTYDGVSIAWAVIEYVYNKIGAQTLFATHYHELAELANKFDKIKNYRMAVLENEDGVVFLHKIIKGGIDRSYGVEVAKLAGLPYDLIGSSPKRVGKI
ncbi:MAG: DNA mismatch repair protein MutS [bacterium]